MRARKAFEEVRLKIVREALSGVKIAVLARAHEVHPETIRGWVKAYRDQIEEEGIPSYDHQTQELKRLQEVEDKYEKAVKILGEKELEIEILRELLKKTNPAYPRSTK